MHTGEEKMAKKKVKIASKIEDVKKNSRFGLVSVL
jgi:hypothetical protein